ncbi:MAG: NAD(P)/FAD-dependent oxidoreductase [Actinomycetota bacterium]
MVTSASRISSAPSTSQHPSGSSRYDAVIVGARVAGAATAMLLARRGLRVLVVDRDGLGSDTLSSHALMRGAVTQLERWGIAPALRAASPAIEQVTFHYRDGAESSATDLPVTTRGASPLLAPRRTLLDQTLVEAGVDAGAEFRHRTRVIDINQHPSGHVTGLRIADEAGRETDITADIVIGADGLRSTVARRLDVPITRQGTEASAFVLRYVEDLDGFATNAYQWLYGPGISAGFIPTNDGRFCVFAGMTRQRFATEIRSDVAAGFQRVLDEIHPEFGEAIRRSTPVSRARAWPGVVGQFRQAAGPGWALVGDAGYFKDPSAAHGISDALRDAELLADAVAAGGTSAERRDHLAAYGETRDRLATPLFDVLERIASYRWTIDELPAIHLELGKTMSVEQKQLAELRSMRGLDADAPDARLQLAA